MLYLFFTFMSANAREIETPFIPDFLTDNLKKLERYKIMPELMSWPPHLHAQITFHDGSLADYGNVVTQQQMLKAPNISWAAEMETEHTVVIMDLDHNVDRSRGVPPNVSEIQYAYWVLGNIPGASLEKGLEIVPYEAPRITDAGNGEMHRICFLVYYQLHGTREFYKPDTVDKIWNYRMWFNHNALSEKYLLTGPLALNFVLAPMKNIEITTRSY
nr:PREDICTED: protein BROTHER of FT and TFL 1-like isoform X1 [Bemisia tabaci]